jgi:catechol 2,3-dioxygenase-like lactoylglutathione lyase family enzyme
MFRRARTDWDRIKTESILEVPSMLRTAVLVCSFFLLFSFVSAQPPQRPKIRGLAFVRVKASDFQKSSETYTKILGLRPSADACIHTTNPCFVVNASQQIELTAAQPGDSGSWLDEVAFQTTSARDMREYLLGQRVRVSEIKMLPHGTSFFETQDPEGNHLAFVELLPGLTVSRSLPNRVSSHILHAGFVVKDLNLMKHFYMDVLGFRLYWKGGFKDVPPGAPQKDSDIDWFALQVPNGTDWIEFMLNIPTNADHRELGIQNHFCLGVPNMQKALDQLYANGLALDSKFADDKSEIGRDGKWQFDIFDPDLTRIEFMEPTPTKAPCCNRYTAPHPKL